MSDLDYDAQLTDDEREALGAALWELDHDSDPRPDVFAAVERILQARLLDLAQRAKADRAAIKAEALREMEFEIRDARTLDPTTKATICAVMRGRARRYEAAALDREEDQ